MYLFSSYIPEADLAESARNSCEMSGSAACVERYNFCTNLISKTTFINLRLTRSLKFNALLKQSLLRYLNVHVSRAHLVPN
jgi:hypothetical protein